MNRLKSKRFKDIVIIAFCLLASVKMITGVMDPYLAAKSENTQLKQEIEDLQTKNDELQKSLDQSENSTDMEEGYMRERFHMSAKDELIFVFPDE